MSDLFKKPKMWLTEFDERAYGMWLEATHANPNVCWWNIPQRAPLAIKKTVKDHYRKLAAYEARQLKEPLPCSGKV